MWTIFYKGVPIHGYVDKSECRIWWNETIYCRTLLGAKRMISKLQARREAQAS